MIKTIGVGVISAMMILTASVIPSVAVQAQTTPWQLFGQICQFTSPNSPQCQQLLQRQQLAAAQQAASTAANTIGTCPINTILSGNTCIPTSTTAASSTCANPSQVISLPQANAGISRSVSSNTLVTLSGALSVPSTILTNCTTQTQSVITQYLWTQTGTGNRVVLNQPNTISPTFISPTVVNGTTVALTFQLIVSDSAGQISPVAATTITVQ